MPERIKYAAVGCGGMGRRHLRGMARSHEARFANIELVAVCDLNQDNANFLADEAHELLGERPRVYADIDQMVREIAGPRGRRRHHRCRLAPHGRDGLPRGRAARPLREAAGA